MTRLEAATGSSYPGNAALGAVDDIVLTEQVAASLAADLREAGVNLDLAPVADVNTNPLNPVIGIRSFGADAELVARHVAAFVRGLQSAGVGPDTIVWKPSAVSGVPSVGCFVRVARRPLPVDFDGVLRLDDAEVLSLAEVRVMGRPVDRSPTEPVTR